MPARALLVLLLEKDVAALLLEVPPSALRTMSRLASNDSGFVGMLHTLLNAVPLMAMFYIILCEHAHRLATPVMQWVTA